MCDCVNMRIYVHRVSMSTPMSCVCVYLKASTSVCTCMRHNCNKPSRLVESIIDNAMLNGEVIRLDGSLRMQPS